MPNLICDTCGGQIDKKHEGIVTFMSHYNGKLAIKDFKLVHKGSCDKQVDTKVWGSCWVAENVLDLRHIINNLNDYGPETQIEGRSLVRVLAQFYQ